MITSILYRYGLIAMFFLIFLEYACFPISSEIVLPLSGAIASVSRIPYFKVLPFSILAGLMGTSVCYAIGRVGGSLLLTRIMNRFPKSRKPIESSYKKFNRYGSLSVCVGRVIPICRTYIAFIAGVVKMDYPTYLFASFFGITIWNSLLIGAGYLLGSNWNAVTNTYSKYKHLFIFLLPFLLFLFILIHRLKRKRATSK